MKCLACNGRGWTPVMELDGDMSKDDCVLCDGTGTVEKAEVNS